MKKQLSLMISNLSVTLMLMSPVVMANDKPLYQITGVKSWDTLNLRSAPGVSSSVVAKIPAAGNSISMVGTQVSVGETVWVKINWQDKEGWVSKFYLKAMSTTPATAAEADDKTEKPTTAVKKDEEKAAKPAPKETAVKEAKKEASKKVAVKEETTETKKEELKPVEKKAGRNNWILSCGDTSPFWKIEVHPKTLKFYKGKYKTTLPITYKKQDKNKWNTAKRTHLKGVTSKDNVDLDIRYSYKRCDHRLSKLKVPYKATMTHNNEEMTGCCRAIKLN